MSKDNYQNFIYLFNNPNSIGVTRLNSSNRKVVSTFLQSQDSLDSLSERNADFSSYQVFSNDATVDDFPTEYISSQRLKQKNISSNFVLAAETGDLQTNIIVKSNDPGAHPVQLPIFKIEGGGQGVSSKISFILSGGILPNEHPDYYFRTGNFLEGVDKGKKYLDYIKLKLLKSPSHSILTKKEQFTYRHIKTLELSDFSLEKETFGLDALNEKVNAFFSLAYLYQLTNSEELGNKNSDIACKIGVPYDFQTVLNDKVNDKGLGISIKQPNYEKIYNYYDPQYEPLIIRLINSLLVDEKSLPSIYDFIFLESQKNELQPIIGLPGFGVDPNRVNIANINQYLDKFAKVYAAFIKRGGKQQTLEEIFADRIVPNVTPAALYMLDPNVPVSKYNENNPVNQVSSKITKQIKSCVMKSLQSDKPGLIPYLPIIQDKKEKIPKWIDSIKTGIYFKETSLNLFNDPLDKDAAFPYLIKVNLPVEKRGPISNLMSEYGFLDILNSYAASINIPTDETNQDGEFFVSGYDTFFGGIINGYNNINYNLFSNVEFPSFKLFLRDAPKPLVEQKSKPGTNPGSGTQPDTQVVSDSFGSPQSNVLGPSPSIPIPGDNANAESQSEDETTNLEDLAESLSVTNPIESTTDIYLNTFEAIGDKALNNVFIYKGESDKNSTLPTSLSLLIEKLKLEKFKDELNNLLFDKKLIRTPTEINSGKMAHQETIMYEITKYKINSLGDQEYVQSIFLPICQQDNLSYYDTQVIPYQDYFYKIYAYKAIVGTEYSLAPFNANKMVNMNSLGRIIIAYDVEPFIQVVRVPYYNTKYVNIKEDKLNYSRIEDAPPLAPQVNFVPFRNVENKLLMLFNNTIGETIQYPKVILPDDKKLFENVYLAQDRKPGDQLLFKSDDSLGTFQMFRTDKLPDYYRSVNEDESLKLVEIKQPENINVAMNTSFIDDILPNKNYYYFFRFLDIHGKISNPTIVYKVMMKKEKNIMPYLQIDTVDLAEERRKEYDSNFTSTKTLQKYLLVELTDNQKQPDYDNVEIDDSDDPDDVSFYGSYSSVKVNFNNSGMNSQSAFGKRFKFRLTSKQTGKKIDINMKVKQPEVKLNN